jgi:RNA polymerase sigma-70 factor (ECF subfamily)
MTATADAAGIAIPMNFRQIETLARSHAGRLASFLRRRVGNPHDVEDLVQDTLLEAMRCMEQFQGQSRPETWLFGIALNLSRSYHKRARVRDIYADVDTDDVPSPGADDPCEIASQRQSMWLVADALEQLPVDSYKLLELVVHDDLSYDEAARELGIPIGTVRSRVSRMRSHLRRSAEQRVNWVPNGSLASLAG